MISLVLASRAGMTFQTTIPARPTSAIGRSGELHRSVNRPGSTTICSPAPALLVTDTGDVVGEQPFLQLLLLEQRLHRVADIEDAQWLRVGAEHRHVLKALRRHDLPDRMKI